MDLGMKWLQHARQALPLRQLRRHLGPGLRPRLLLSLVLVTFLALAASRVLLHLPKSMLAVAAGLFLLCCAVFALVGRHLQGSLAFRIAGLYLTWVGLAATLFWAAFHLDRSRWFYYEVTGFDISHSEEKSHLADVPVRAFLAYNKSFMLDPEAPENLLLPRGEHVFDHTVVVPRSTRLRIEAGAVLRFADGAALISYSPVLAQGNESAPILFTSHSHLRKWGAVGIVGGGLSVFEHVRFENGRQARVNGTDFFGTLSLIGADVEIRNAEFLHLRGKDGVYVRGGRVQIHDNLFEDVRKDGLDLDSSSGSVSGNRFVDCGDEGIDVGQAGALEITGNVILDSRGGSIEADSALEQIKGSNTLGYSRH